MNEPDSKPEKPKKHLTPAERHAAAYRERKRRFWDDQQGWGSLGPGKRRRLK